MAYSNCLKMFVKISFLSALLVGFILISPGIAQEFDILKIIDINNKDDIESVRNELNDFIFGEEGLKYNSMPDSVTSSINDEDFKGMPNLKEITRLTIETDWGLNSIVYLFIPHKANNQSVIYHQGHNGKFSHGKNTIAALLERGYHVVGMSMPLLGMNRQPVVDLSGFGKVCISSHNLISYLSPVSGHPIRYFLDPVTTVVNYLQQFNFDRISMVGISGGGWTTTLYAAVDPRIQYSFPVAGTFPLYLRSQDLPSIGDYEQYVPEVYEVVNYLEMYILGSFGENRKQVQVLNEFDKCCFSGTGYRTYVDIIKGRVQKLGKGSFDVFLDSSHHEHKISDIAIGLILESLEE